MTVPLAYRRTGSGLDSAEMSWGDVNTVQDNESADRTDGRSGRLLVLAGVLLVLLGIALFGTALVVLGPLPDTLAEFAQRWIVRGLAAALVFSGLWCGWTGWKRLS